MTYYCISASSGFDSSGAGAATPSLAALTPFRTFAKIISSVTLNAGDSVLLQRGGTFTEQITLDSFTAGTISSPIVIDAYASGNLPVIAPAAASCVTLGGSCGGFAVRNLATRPADAWNGVHVGTNQTTACTIELLEHQGGAVGIYVQPNPTAKNIPLDWNIRKNKISKTRNSGFQWIGSGSRWRFSQNELSHCCTAIANNAMEVYCYTATGAALSWSLDSGNVYKAVVPQQLGLNVDFVHSLLIFFNPFPTGFYCPQDAGATTTPGPFQFGFISGTQTLYVNLGGVDPSTGTGSQWNYGYFANWVIEYNRITNTVKNGTEGHGMLIDFNSGRGTIRGNYVAYNGGCGIQTSGPFVNIYGNICEYNALNQINVPFYGSGVAVNNNTCVQSPGLAGDSNNCLLSWLGSADTQTAYVQNNVCEGGSYSMSLQSGGGTTYAANKNNLHGATSAQFLNGSGTGTTNLDPQLDKNYRPRNATLRGAGVNVQGSDFYGHEFPDAPDIGAVQYVGARSSDSSRTSAARMGVA